MTMLHDIDRVDTRANRSSECRSFGKQAFGTPCVPRAYSSGNDLRGGRASGTLGTGSCSESRSAVPEARLTDTISHNPIRAGLPWHPLILGVPSVCFVTALVTDIAYMRTYDFIWNDFSAWLLAVGIVLGALAAMAWANVGTGNTADSGWGTTEARAPDSAYQ